MLRNVFRKRMGAWPLDGTDYSVLAAGLAIFAVVVLATITKFSVWFDEAFGAYLIRFDFWQIAGYTAADVHPPLYYWLLKGWSLLFGTSELALRSMSVFFGMVAILFGYVLAKRLFGRKAAIYSLAFMILTPLFIRYSQEMRMYTLAAAIVMAATYVMTLAMETGKRKLWIVYGILVSLGMWTHYFTALAWLGHWVWRAWILRHEKKPKNFLRKLCTKDWVIAYAVAVGTFLPWMPFLAYQVLNVQINGFWIPPVSPVTLPNFLTNVLYYQDQNMVNPWPTLLFVGIVIALIALAIRLYRTLDKERLRSYMLVWSLAFVPIILLLIFSMPPLRSSFVDRYLIPSSLAISLFIGVTLALVLVKTRLRWKFLLPVAIIGAFIYGVANVYDLGNYNKTQHNSQNTRQLVREIAAVSAGDEPIIADSPWIFYEAVFYSTMNHPVYFIDATTDYKFGSLEMLRTNDDHKIKDLVGFVHDYDTIWYIGRPGSGDLVKPVSSWTELQRITINDSLSGEPAYKAVQYRVGVSSNGE